MKWLFNILGKRPKTHVHYVYVLKVGEYGNQDIYVKDARINEDTTGYQKTTANLTEAKIFKELKGIDEFAQKNLFSGYEIVKKKSWLYKKQ